MNKKICCFAGHRNIYIDDELKILIYNKCEELIKNENVQCFWVGNYGSFDKFVSLTIRKIQKKYQYIELNLVLPYITQEINQYKKIYHSDYDNIIIADISERTPAKFKILKCNQYMINNSDFLIAYVNHSFGGASKTLEYAQKKNHIKIFNFGNY